jgi:predicted DNA-binding ribbon-helix-helix protein
MNFEPIAKRSVVVDGHKTSISVEKCFWDELRRIAANRDLAIGEFVGEIADHHPANLSSALRQVVLADLLSARASLSPPVLAPGAPAAALTRPQGLPSDGGE